jgi:hypothetical protein
MSFRMQSGLIKVQGLVEDKLLLFKPGVFTDVSQTVL